MERRKYMGRVKEKYISKHTSKVMRVDACGLKGYTALTLIHEVHIPFIAGDICLYDNGYSELNYLPYGEQWQLSALYDASGDIFEWYFDITKKNAVDEEGNPYCDDLYLDAALMPDGRLLILDEDELKDALDSGSITRSDYDSAYDTLGLLSEKNILNAEYLYQLCAKLRLLFEQTGDI